MSRVVLFEGNFKYVAGSGQTSRIAVSSAEGPTAVASYARHFAAEHLRDPANRGRRCRVVLEWLDEATE